MDANALRVTAMLFVCLLQQMKVIGSSEKKRKEKKRKEDEV